MISLGKNHRGGITGLWSRLDFFPPKDGSCFFVMKICNCAEDGFGLSACEHNAPADLSQVVVLMINKLASKDTQARSGSAWGWKTYSTQESVMK